MRKEFVGEETLRYEKAMQTRGEKHDGYVLTADGRTLPMKGDTVTRAFAVAYAPWAGKIVKVEGGYMAFESVVDYETWKKQK